MYSKQQLNIIKRKQDNEVYETLGRQDAIIAKQKEEIAFLKKMIDENTKTINDIIDGEKKWLNILDLKKY